eukprot:12044-Eustigmatos_ZCMA.PRE.1
MSSETLSDITFASQTVVQPHVVRYASEMDAEILTRLLLWLLIGNLGRRPPFYMAQPRNLHRVWGARH